MSRPHNYTTIQITRVVKDQIVDYCNGNDLKIGKFIERLFINHVSGSILAKV
jgi:hypothetical protein